MENEQKQYVTAEVMAKRLAITETLLARLRRARKIPSYKIGHKTYRFDPVDVERAMQKMLIPERTVENRHLRSR